MICGSVEQGGVRAGSPCSCVLGFAGAPGSVVLALPAVGSGASPGALGAGGLELAGSSLQTQVWSWVTQFGVWIVESCIRVPTSRETEILVFPSSLPVPGRSTGMGRGELMELERKGKERRSRNAQARSNGKSVTAVLQSNTEPGA